MKPRVAIDVDDVLADFIGATLFYVHSQTGVRVPRSRLLTWDLREAFPEEIRESVTEVWNSQGFCATLQPIRGAPDAIQLLRDHYRVSFLTTPLKTNSWWKTERQLWLQTFFGAKKSDVIFAHDKAAHAKDFAALVDDKYAHVSAWHEASGKPAILIGQPHNAGEKWRWRAPHIYDAVRMLQNHAIYGRDLK